ncbi:hypothetical protein FIBSPDRAFT_854463 [Athelia psychrophila]|uniref:Uncharacterized protein n=1 Tax=Athelia psychrophila TaxID=1759441 RepID=A0A166Q5K4_9AGAM|nr:hypothetical protein FIBSPDRAFT_854463 [Fibularhizoctonia sp. CBS 109695]
MPSRQMDTQLCQRRSGPVHCSTTPGTTPLAWNGWRAFNAEHSNVFGGGIKPGSMLPPAKMYTYAATRPLRTLYFDGFSASKQGGGVLNMQNIIVYDDVHAGDFAWFFADTERGKLLCEWGRQYGIEGFVREEATYELIWCDFSVGLQLISATDMLMPASDSEPSFVTPSHSHSHDDFSSQVLAQTPGRWSPPDMSPWMTPYGEWHQWSMYRAASWHHTRADTRITPHPEYLVTLYDPVYSSLAANNRLSRLEHNLVDLSDEDREIFLKELDGALRAWNDDAKDEGVSGVDWVAIAQAVVDRTGDTLAELHALISDIHPAAHATEVVSNARLAAFALLMAYVDHTALFAPRITTAERSSVLADVSKRCSVVFTGHIDAPAYNLTLQERRLKHAVEGVSQRICSFASGVLEEALNLLDTFPEDRTVVWNSVATWREGVEDLMGWLGWAMWERCPRMCGLDEQCYIPMWPVDRLAEPDSPAPLVPRCIKKEDFKMIC